MPRSGADGGDAERERDDEREPSPSWLDVVDEVIDESIDRGTTVEATVEDLTVAIPVRFGPDASLAEWRFDGGVRIHVDGASGPLAEWLRWWAARTARRGGSAAADPGDASGPDGSDDRDPDPDLDRDPDAGGR